jgi:soluble lytic murein transglycosylase-like protein
LPIRPLVRAALAAVALACAFPAAAHAQIYAWQDASGHWVLSDQAKNPAARTYNVPGAVSFRATKPFSRKAAQYQSLIEEHSELNSVSADLVRALIQAESAFNPFARSPKGAMGLMQLMPATAAEYGVSNPYDPVENVRAGVKYLRRLLDAYEGKVELALAAYNAGPAAVKKYGGTVPPYRETRDYVARIKDNVGATGTSGQARATRLYQTVEVIDGREVVRYTSTPRSGSEVVKALER